MTKDHVTAAGLTMGKPKRVRDRFETLDSPIARIGLHLLENLGGRGHNKMILQVTLYRNVQFGRNNRSARWSACNSNRKWSAVRCGSLVRQR